MGLRHSTCAPCSCTCMRSTTLPHGQCHQVYTALAGHTAAAGLAAQCSGNCATESTIPCQVHHPLPSTCARKSSTPGRQTTNLTSPSGGNTLCTTTTCLGPSGALGAPWATSSVVDTPQPFLNRRALHPQCTPYIQGLKVAPCRIIHTAPLAHT
jgi:hypothetical protein